MTDSSRLFFGLVRDFLVIYLPRQKASSLNTIKSYRAALNLFFTYATRLLDINLCDLSLQISTRQLLESFLDYLEIEKGCSVSSRNQRLAAIRRFYKYASEREISAVATYIDLSMIPFKKQKEEHVIEFFSEAALKAILAEPDASTQKGLRDRVFMILLYDTGCRLQEILDLRICDMNIFQRDRYVRVTGKGGKTRLVPIMEKTEEHLATYMKQFHNPCCDTDYLFYVKRKGIRQQMSQANVAKFLKIYATAARSSCGEVPEHVYAHMFRHSRAMHLYRNGMPLTLVSEWLGHSQVETTMTFYANADIRMKREAIEKATAEMNPLLESTTGFVFTDDEVMLKKLYGLT